MHKVHKAVTEHIWGRRKFAKVQNVEGQSGSLPGTHICSDNDIYVHIKFLRQRWGVFLDKTKLTKIHYDAGLLQPIIEKGDHSGTE